MPQPIPKRIKENKPELCKQTFNTLLVDGSNILELSSLGDKTISSSGTEIGGIFQFFLQHHHTNIEEYYEFEKIMSNLFRNCQ